MVYWTHTICGGSFQSAPKFDRFVAAMRSVKAASNGQARNSSHRQKSVGCLKGITTCSTERSSQTLSARLDSAGGSMTEANANAVYRRVEGCMHSSGRSGPLACNTDQLHD